MRRTSMSDETCPTIEVSRRIEAPASAIFKILADPTKHLAIDGSEMLRGAATEEVVTDVGDVFVMNMYFERLGDYQMNNHIVEFEPGRRISWEPEAGAGHREPGTRVGHRWGFTLEPDGPDATMVTETYDCSRAPREFREGMDSGRIWMEGMAITLERLDRLASGS
jgi:uncharacterized protein YndB with AHSA1/START domain